MSGAADSPSGAPLDATPAAPNADPSTDPPASCPASRDSHEDPATRSSRVSLPPFQHLVDAHWPDVGRLARGLVGPDAAEDVAQQAWLQAFAAYPRLRSARNLRGWLLTITHRCAMDHHRRTARAATDPHDPADVTRRPRRGNPASRRPSTIRATRCGPPSALFRTAEREAVVLRYVADLDHAMIARALSTTPTMSRRLVSDGLAALRKTLT
ncbi:MAG: sigma-70 family RNA polymerase sigma factor [Dermatophilaceae bacterium]